jgi:hypothetical protein
VIRDHRETGSLERFYHEHSPRVRTAGNGHHTHAPTQLGDEEIIELCRNARNAPKFEALFDRGDVSAYADDDSAADQALVSLIAFYTDDPDQFDRIFRRSALCREKWTGRPDYRRRTIEKARAGARRSTRGPRNQAYPHRPNVPSL